MLKRPSPRRLGLLGVIGALVLAVLLVVSRAGFTPLPFLRGGGAPRAPRLAHADVTFAWPEFHGKVEIESDEDLAVVQSLLEDVRTRAGLPEPQAVFWSVTLDWSDDTATTLDVTRDHRLFEAGKRVEWVAAALREWVRARTQELEERFFGELLTWPEVSAFFPVGGIAVVRDLETGKTFRVRRHRGDAHADVEPLTSQDAQALKDVYGGEWSWKRRAVVLNVGERQVAGSMNGMPHGWGDIFDNDFVGHSCIHFWKSRVHGTWRPDPGHQLQVLKAAGKLAETLDAASPEELAKWAVAAVNHQDVVSLRYMADLAADPPAFDRNVRFSTLLSQLALPIRHITYIGARLVEKDALSASVLVSATVYYREPDPDQGYPKQAELRLRRDGETEPWRVDLASLLPMARPGEAGVEAMSAVRFDEDPEVRALAMECQPPDDA